MLLIQITKGILERILSGDELCLCGRQLPHGTCIPSPIHSLAHLRPSEPQEKQRLDLTAWEELGAHTQCSQGIAHRPLHQPPATALTEARSLLPTEGLQS